MQNYFSYVECLNYPMFVSIKISFIAYITLLIIGMPFGVQAEVLDRVVASIDGAPVTESEVVKELALFSPSQSVKKPLDSESIKAGLTGLLLGREAARMGITVSREEIDQQISMVISRSNISMNQFEKSLLDAGMSMAQYRDKLSSELNRNRVVGSILKQRIQVSDEELSAYMGTSQGQEVENEGRFGLLRLSSLVKDIDKALEADKLSKYLKEGGICESYKSSTFIACENLGIFKVEDLKEGYARSLDASLNYEFGDLIEENGTNYYLLKIDANLSKKNSNVGLEIRDKLFQEKFKAEAEKFLGQEIFEKYSVEMHF